MIWGNHGPVTVPCSITARRQNSAVTAVGDSVSVGREALDAVATAYVCRLRILVGGQSRGPQRARLLRQALDDCFCSFRHIAKQAVHKAKRDDQSDARLAVKAGLNRRVLHLMISVVKKMDVAKNGALCRSDTI